MLGAIPNDKWDSLENGGTIEQRDETLRSKLWDFVVLYPGAISSHGQTDLLKHPTEAFPNGIPTGANLTLTMQPDYAIRTASDPGKIDMSMETWLRPYWNLSHNPSRLNGRDRFNFLSLEQLVRNQLLIPCIRSATTVRVEIAKDVSFIMTFYSVANEFAPPSSFDNLPDPFRRAAFAQWNRFDKLYSLAPPGG